MPALEYEDGLRPFTNTTGATLLSGDLVILPDSVAGIVEGLAGVRNGARGMCRIRGIVSIDKLTGTVIAARDRIEYQTATKRAIPNAATATLPNFICGRAIEAAGSGTLSVLVQLNDNGPTI